MVEPVISESCPYSRLQICICLAVLGVFFAINAHVGISDSSYTISVAASVIVFVILILMACVCAPLTFSTEFEADAKRKVIRFHATFLGCITWRSMCSTCKFQDAQFALSEFLRRALLLLHHAPCRTLSSNPQAETNIALSYTSARPLADPKPAALYTSLTRSLQKTNPFVRSLTSHFAPGFRAASESLRIPAMMRITRALTPRTSPVTPPLLPKMTLLSSRERREM
jgi:hypothetical protein